MSALVPQPIVVAISEGALLTPGSRLVAPHPRAISTEDLDDWMRTTMKLVKASVLYADRIILASTTQIAGYHRDVVSEFGETLSILPLRITWGLLAGDARGTWDGPWMDCDSYAAVCHVMAGVELQPEHVPRMPPAVGRALDELRQAVGTGVLYVAPTSPPSLVDTDNAVAADGNILLGNWEFISDQARDAHARARLEAEIAASLLGQLEAFPNASMDVLLDVRERLTVPRTYFRAALNRVSKTLAEAGESGEQIDRIVTGLRIEEIDPALRIMRQEVGALKVRRTLQRLAAEPAALTAASAALSMAAGAGPTGEIVHTLLSALLAPTAVAAAVKEANFREMKVAELRSRPYWMLHEADERLRVA